MEPPRKRRLHLHVSGKGADMKGVKLLYGASVLMVLGFCVHILVDYLAYRKSFTSAPFWVWITAPFPPKTCSGR